MGFEYENSFVSCQGHGTMLREGWGMLSSSGLSVLSLLSFSAAR